MIRYTAGSHDPEIILPIQEISDKPIHTAVIARRFQIPDEHIVVIGDSGGDGPHFNWGARIGATLIASLAKDSLLSYCRERRIDIHHHWNPGAFAGAEEASVQSKPLSLDQLFKVIMQVMGR